MQDYSYFEVTVKTNELGIKESENYKWIGKSPYIYISRPFVFDMVGATGYVDPLKIGGYRLLVVEENLATDSYLYVRSDKFGFLRILIYRATRILDLFYRRFIITLAVWNLAEYKTYRLPDWKDVKIIRKLFSKWI